MLQAAQRVRRLPAVVRPPFENGTIWSTCSLQRGSTAGLSPHSTQRKRSRCMIAWRSAALEVQAVPQWTAVELAERARADRDLVILDVRQPAEWQAGRVPRARHIPGGELPARLDELPRDEPIAVYCGSGYRSSVATSVLKRAGRAQVFNLLGGFAAWRKSGLPVEGDRPR